MREWPVPVAEAAEMFSLNLSVWKDDPVVSRLVASDDEIAALLASSTRWPKVATPRVATPRAAVPAGSSGACAKSCSSERDSAEE